MPPLLSIYKENNIIYGMEYGTSWNMEYGIVMEYKLNTFIGLIYSNDS
jgi:hypothetical protein